VKENAGNFLLFYIMRKAACFDVDIRRVRVLEKSVIEQNIALMCE
jgi:hypothetical protein